jgi:hypothetical protein
VGVAVVTVGVTNMVFPMGAFPSSATCVTDYDLVVCYHEMWWGAPFAIAMGVAFMFVGVRLKRAG